MNLSNLQQINQKSIDQRANIDDYNSGQNASVHSAEFHQFKRDYPYCGFVDIDITGSQNFVMFSNNDDQICQTYHFFGRDAFESYSMELWVKYSKQAHVIFDVGTFTGVYSLAAFFANTESKVHAFEPIKKIYSRFIGNLYTNRIGQKVIFNNVALSDESGIVQMTVYQGDLTMSTGSSIISKKGKDVISTEHVYCSTFDEYIKENQVETIDLIKIDAEQAEHMVIAGGREFFKKHSPVMLIEIIGVERIQKILDIVDPQYEVFMIEENSRQLHKLNKSDLENESCLQIVNNYLWKTPDK